MEARQQPARAPMARRRAGRLRREWLLLSLAVLALVAGLSLSGALRRVDHLLHDAAMRRHVLPPTDEVVLIAIDDASLEAIGRWPWRRALHAQMLATVAAQGPRAIGLDILFGEADADYPGDDLLLARALDRAGNVVLPVAQRSPHGFGSSVDGPLPLLRTAAAQLGHVQVQVDSDGITRRLYRREGPQSSPWPHLSIALLCAAGESRSACRGNRPAASGPWIREEPRILTFTSGRPAFTVYSYVDVLKGRLPPGALQDRYVLVGATAVGLGDMLVAPLSNGTRRIPGVELLAHALHAEQAAAYLRPLPFELELGLHLGIAAAALLGVALLGPAAGLGLSVALALATLAAALATPALVGWQFAATPALAGIALAWPLWSWRRLGAAAHFLQLEMQALQLQLPPPVQGKRSYMDALERRIHAVEDASARLRRLHHFISLSLQHLPSPTLACDGAGRILLANDAAEDHLAHVGLPLEGRLVGELLADLRNPSSGEPLLPAGGLDQAAVPPRQEGRDARGRDLLALCQHHRMDARSLWLITLVDLTPMRRAQRQRDQALHFISHDIRAPAASILTLLEMWRSFPGRMSQQQLLERIERHAQASLGMAQGFVRLASAQADTYEQAPFDLAHVLQEALDDAWANAQKKGLGLELAGADEAAPVAGDRSLVLRAVANVLGNAIKFSPAGAAVRCALAAEAGEWVVTIADQGPGVAPELQARIFEPFRHANHDGANPQGVGLGLAFVRTVLERHGGQVRVRNQESAGACFELRLPRHTEAA